ncbi:MAG: ABC transporter permease [Rhodanobacteraceae bacterium]
MEIRPILASLRHHKLTVLLLVLEVALTSAIVTNAVFMIEQRLHRMDAPSGIAENQLVEVQVAAIRKGSTAAEQARTQTDMAALRQIPGVRQVAITWQLPFTGSSGNSTGIKLHPEQQHYTAQAAEYLGENLLPTLGLRLVAGRDFGPDGYVDLTTATAGLNSGRAVDLPHTLIVTRALGERLWPGQNALGKVIYLGGAIPMRVIGVVARLARMNPFLIGSGPGDSLILPIRMSAAHGGIYVLRCAPQDRARVLREALAALKKIDPNRVLLTHRTYEQARHAFFANDRAVMGTLVGVIVALLLVTALGIVGLVSFWVSQRTKQIGIRRALGATRGDILRYFQTENFLIVTGGVVLGVILAVGLNLLLMQHYQLPRLPLWYLPIGAVVLWLLGQLAVLAPALRAAAVPPVVATRSV